MSVCSAAGAMGSLVGQIVTLKGCTVIGFAGTDEKVNILSNNLGFHHAFHYKTANINCLKTVAPNGVDCYFDNGGGSLSKNIIGNMKDGGRVAICGSISTYGPCDKARHKELDASDIKIKSFGFNQWKWAELKQALDQLREWLLNKTLKKYLWI